MIDVAKTFTPVIVIAVSATFELLPAPAKMKLYVLFLSATIDCFTLAEVVLSYQVPTVVEIHEDDPFHVKVSPMF